MLTNLDIDGKGAASKAFKEAQSFMDGKTLKAKMTIDGSFIYGGEKLEGFATGGRATTASIFGEAGPEWAIPEEHTNRTAELLNRARAASGFSWGEILASTGGLGGGSTPTTIIYSPNITANDANGVESALLRDKDRLDKWWKTMKQRERMVTFA